MRISDWSSDVCSSDLLISKAMTAPDGIVRIPLNESSDPKSQINEYLNEYHGEGIQHIACFTDNIYATVEAMRERGVAFLDNPDTYFSVVDEQLGRASGRERVGQ